MPTSQKQPLLAGSVKNTFIASLYAADASMRHADTSSNGIAYAARSQHISRCCRNGWPYDADKSGHVVPHDVASVALIAQKMDLICNENFTMLLKNYKNWQKTAQKLKYYAQFYSIQRLALVINWICADWPSGFKSPFLAVITKDWQLEGKFTLYRALLVPTNQP